MGWNFENSRFCKFSKREELGNRASKGIVGGGGVVIAREGTHLWNH